MQRNEARGELELVRRFINTRDIEEGSERLHSPDALLTWFAGVDLLDDEAVADEKDLERALALREGIRALLLGNNGEETETVRIRDLNRAIGSVCLTVRFDDNGGATQTFHTRRNKKVGDDGRSDEPGGPGRS